MSDFKNKLFSGKTIYTGGQISKLASNLVQKSNVSGSNLTPGYMKFLKANPRVNRNYSGKTENYIYVLLDPFKPLIGLDDFKWNIPSKIFGVDEIRFGFEPFYIGKGVSSTGHRMNQHIARYNQNSDSENEKKENLYKHRRLESISMNFRRTAKEEDFYITPKNWDEYKKEWIITIFEFPDRESLEVAEKELIKIIGSINGIKKGPLTNISFTKEK